MATRPYGRPRLRDLEPGTVLRVRGSWHPTLASGEEFGRVGDPRARTHARRVEQLYDQRRLVAEGERYVPARRRRSLALRRRGRTGWYDVLRSDGTAVNAAALRRPEAERLAAASA